MLGAASHSCHCPDSEELQNPEERNEKAKEFRAAGALEQGFHCPCLTQQFVPWHRHSLSRILIWQSLKLRRSEDGGTEQGLSGPRERLSCAAGEPLGEQEGGRNGFSYFLSRAREKEAVLWHGKVKVPCSSSYLLSVLGGQVSQGFHGGLGDPKTHNKHKRESKGDGGICMNAGAVLCQTYRALGCPGRGCWHWYPPWKLSSHQALWQGMCVCHHRTCHDTEIIWVNQTFHGSGESRLWEEPSRRGWKQAEGRGSVWGC